MIYLMVGPWTWDSVTEVTLSGGPGDPSNWDSCSLLSDFLCALEPNEPIVNKSILDFPPDPANTMEFFGIMQRSPATAEGTYWLTLEPPTSSRWRTWAALTTSFYSAFGCGPLSLAALEGSLKKMENLLTKFPDTVNELNLLKQTPLHLAVGRPSCVALLLRGSGRKLIDLPDSAGRRPLEYALSSCLCSRATGQNQYHDGCLNSHGDTSLNLLLDADCMIPKVESWPHDRYTFQNSLCDNCLRKISAHLIDRREGLKRLAENNLPRMQAIALGLFSPSLLDSNTTRVIQALYQRGVPVSPSLQVNGSDGEEGCNESSSAYHSYFGPVPLPALWNLGFRELDTPDADGLTPLMMWCKQFGSWATGPCSWLTENGADLWKLAPDGVSTIGHELYSRIGQLSPPWDDNEDN